jgi:hypothetical protein
MSIITPIPTELIWAGPSASYAAQAAASSAAQFLMPGATGAFEQPYIPANFWQIGRRNQRVQINLAGLLTGQSSATTAIFTVGLTNLSNTATLAGGGGALVACSAVTVTNMTAAGWRLQADVLTRMVGYGTTSISTSLLTDAEVKIGGGSGSVTAGAVGLGVPTLLSTIDAGAQFWVYATVTFSTASATNSCQLTRADVWGLN